jgi:uncharacterized protein
VDRSLARGVLSQSRGDDIAHDALVHLIGIESRAVHDFTNHQRTQLHSRKIRQRTLKFSDWSANSGDNDYVFHYVLPHCLDAEALSKQHRNTITRATLSGNAGEGPSEGRAEGQREIKDTEGMTTMEPPAIPSEQEHRQGGRLLAPWWHTALMVVLILGLSVAGVRQLRSVGAQPLHLVTNYSLTIAYEWILAALVIWGIHMRKVPLRQLLGEQRPGARAWWKDAGLALGYWAVALIVLALLGNILMKVSGSHIDPQKIGDVTQRLAPVTALEIVLFLVLSISAGICEELVFRGYLQQQFARMGRRVWAGVVFSALVFGCAHGYEGIAGVLLISAYGAMFGVLALLRRGLRTGMIAHAWHDSISGVALMLLRHYGVHLAGK